MKDDAQTGSGPSGPRGGSTSGVFVSPLFRAPEGLEMATLTYGASELLVLSYPIAPEPTLDSLTPAEREIAGLVLDGRSNAEIAELRGRSISTVINQISSIFRKLGVRSRTELAQRTGR